MSAPCPQCVHLRDSPGCQEFQASSGCHACGVVGCWRTNLTCRYYNRDRVKHRDAGLGDTVPHMREVNAVCVADGSAREGLQNINWWLGRQVHFVFQRDLVYFMGSASGDECNCLIDSLRQCLDVICDVGRVRSLVQRSNPHLIFGDYMELQHHWRDVIRCIGVVLGMNLTPQDFSIICVDALHVGHGDREGTGTRTLYIARQNANHFVPLFHCSRGVEEIRAVASHIPFQIYQREENVVFHLNPKNIGTPFFQKSLNTNFSELGLAQLDRILPCWNFVGSEAWQFPRDVVDVSK